jgi:hypothetical protein
MLLVLTSENTLDFAHANIPASLYVKLPTRATASHLFAACNDHIVTIGSEGSYRGHNLVQPDHDARIYQEMGLILNENYYLL